MTLLRRFLVLLWALFLPGASLYLIGANGILDPRHIVFFCVYLLSTLALITALSRDREMTTLTGFLSSRAGRILTTTVLVLLIATTALSLLFAVTFLVIFAGLFFVFWARSESSGALSEMCLKPILLLLSCSITLALCEAALRIPGIANRLLPPAHCAAHDWTSRDDYDDAAFTAWKGRTFRSFHLDVEETGGEFTILILGDSFTWGDKIRRTGDTWPYTLEKTLAVTGIPNRVISLAQCGNTTVNELEYLQEYGWDLNPDAIIVQYIVNDPLPSEPGFQHEVQSWMKATVFPIGFSHRIDKLHEKSYLFSLLHVRWSEAVRYLFGLKSLNYFDLHEDGFPPWEETKQAIGQIAGECRERDVPLLITMFPVFTNGTYLDDRYPYLPLHEKMREMVETQNVSFFDLLPGFAEINPEANSWWALPTNGHPNASAHQIAGREIASELQRLGVVSPD